MPMILLMAADRPSATLICALNKIYKIKYYLDKRCLFFVEKQSAQNYK